MLAFLTLDIGTTGCKALVLSPEGDTLGNACREYPLSYPQQGWVELDANLVWKKIREVIAEVAYKVGRKNIKSLCVSSQGEAFVPVDRGGGVLHNAITTLDSRAENYANWCEERISKERVFEITGLPVSGMFTLSKILWLRENRPEIFRRTSKFLCFEDFAFYKMGLYPVIDHSLAGKTMALDIWDKCWSSEILDIYGIDERMLSELAPSGKIIGQLSSSAAKELGLAQETRVITGGHDQAMAALGAGLLGGGVAVDSTGTTESIGYVLDEPLLNPIMLKYNYPCYPYVLESRYYTVAFTLCSGNLLKWYRDTLGSQEIEQGRREGKDPYEVIIDKACPECSNIYVLPHLTFTGTPYLDANSRGAILGLTLSTTKEEIIKALLEGVALELELNLKYLSEAGINIQELRAVGGGAKSDKWLQLKADIFKRKMISLKNAEAACVGGAILSGKALGEFSSFEEATSRMVKVEQIFIPDRQKGSIYEKKMEIFKQIYPRLRSLLHRM